MKKISLYISALAIAALGLTACDDRWETPPMDVPTEGADVNPTLTIAELKALYWQDATSYGTPVTKLADGRNAIIKGTIVSSTESGNIYKSVYIQDSTAAICIGVDTASVSAVMPMGVGVAIDVTGLQIGRYSGAMQLGKADGTSVNRITFKELKPHLALDYFGGKLDTTVTTLAELPRPNQESIREWGGKLVRINDVKFLEAGQTFAQGSNNTSRVITDSLGKNQIIIYNSPYADFAYNKMPGGIGDVVGILSNYNTQWQLLLIDINGVIGFEGGGEFVEKPAPELPDEYKDAMSVAEALELIKTGQNNPDAEVMVFGRISSISSIDTSYGNATYFLMDYQGLDALEVYRGYWLNGSKFTSEDQLSINEYIIVKGKLVNYNGTAEFTTGSQVVYYFGETSEGPSPGETPEAPTDVINVATALDLIANGYEGNAQVKGLISKIDDVDTGSYGNATYYIVDEMGSTQALEVFRGYWFNGAKFTSKDQIEVGAEVIVDGKLVNYNGTPEFTSGSKIISYNGQTSAPDTPGDEDPGDDNPAEPGAVVVLDNWTATNWTGGADGWEGVVNGYNLKVEKGGSTSSMENAKPNNYAIRVYKNGYFTITAPEGVKFMEVRFDLDSTTTAFTASVPSGWTATTGSSDNATFTVSSKSASNSLKLTASAGQIRIAKITVVTAE